jgi:hypothetical protein
MRLALRPLRGRAGVGERRGNIEALMARQRKTPKRGKGRTLLLAGALICFIISFWSFLEIRSSGEESVLAESSVDNSAGGVLDFSTNRPQVIWVYLWIPANKVPRDFGLTSSEIRRNMDLQMDSEAFARVDDSYPDTPGRVLLAKGNVNGSKAFLVHWEMLSGKPLPSNWRIMAQSQTDSESWRLSRIILEIVLCISGLGFLILTALFILASRQKRTPRQKYLLLAKENNTLPLD